ncbi:hypothetical protein A9Q84_17670 [Halobacteriovorax marinus]|uniref:Lipoprotein n=1 Tax=Halobacteriovorax marinus TaxID=97084 RepID=A0A1Y5F746_9BACT|nr:hypothetical protein A9Q84_17670 [Halobacteriovorax marinus]
MRKYLIVLLGLFLFSCSHGGGSRTPSSTDYNLNKLIGEISSSVVAGIVDTKLCSAKLSNYGKRLLSLSDEHIDSALITDGKIDQIIKKSFRTRLEIKEKMKGLKVVSAIGVACLHSIKDIVRALRYVEDYMIEIKFFRLGYLKSMDFVTFAGSGSQFLVNPVFEFSSKADLKSGDIILSRGHGYSSAAIARIGENESQFSHLSLVYRDESNDLHTIESLTEVGAVTAPMQVYIDQKNVRSVVLRHSDSKLAHEAAKSMYQKVRARQLKKKNIAYDFEMNYKDSKNLFSAEIIYHAFKNAAKKLYSKKLDLPLYKTNFEKGLLSFLKDLGLKVNASNISSSDTFGPGDIQFDPSFSIVAEWRNPKKMRDNRFKDVVLTKIFEWIEVDNYRLFAPAGIIVKSRFSWLMRRTPFVKKMLEDKFPLNMKARQLKLFLVLDLVGEKLYNKLSDAQAIAKRTLSPIEMHEVLQDFKENDYKRYIKFIALSREARKYRGRRKVPYNVKKELKETRPIFHRYFHN